MRLTPEGDIVCHKTADALYLDAKTEKGKALLDSLESVTESADESAVEEQKKTIREQNGKTSSRNSFRRRIRQR